MKDLYLYISSNTSKDIYPDNRAANFRVRLPQTLYLQGSWSIALVDIDMPKLSDNYKPQHIIFQSSVCKPCVHKDSLDPIIQRLYYSEIRKGQAVYIAQPRYLLVNNSILEVFDMHITDDLGNKVSFKEGSLECTLHLMKYVITC